MPNRKVADFLKIVDGKTAKPEHRGSAPADVPPPGSRGKKQEGIKKQRVPKPPPFLSEAEQLAWKNICKPICDRALWSDKYTLWAESYAILLARSRSENRDDPDHKINQAQLRLYANDLRQILNVVQS